MIRLLWLMFALALGLAVGLLLTATQAPHADPRPHYYVMETP